MRKILFLAFLLIISFVNAQIKSGKYEDVLKIAYNSENKTVTGFYENYTGIDESTGNPKFSCVFYFIGAMNSNTFEIESYYPTDINEKIKGTIKIIDSTTISIKLQQEHGGCWNVQNFSNEDVIFKLTENFNWKEIRFVNIDKSYFYNEAKEETKRKSYLIKGDIFYIEKIQGDWVLGAFIGKKTTKGWLKKSTLNY